MVDIKIYGEIVPFEDAWIIEQGGYCNLTHLQNQLKDAKGEDVRIRINSCGGDVDTGFAMYAELRRYAKDNNAKVTTFGEARVQSIATVFFLAGDERILTEHTEPFVHNAWNYTMGDSKAIMRIAIDLDKCNKKIAEHYALHTDLTVDEALELMENETSISTTEAKAMRFATEIEEVLRPVALKRFSTNNKPINKMNKKKGAMAKILDILKGFQNKVVMSADQTEVDFYELEEDEIVEVGAKANIDGSKAEGSVVMADGNTYVFEMGELMEIIEKTDAVNLTEDEEVEMDALKEENENLKAEIEELKAKLEETKASNKSMKSAMNKIKDLESEFVEQPSRTVNKTNVRQSVAAKAIKGLK